MDEIKATEDDIKAAQDRIKQLAKQKWKEQTLDRAKMIIERDNVYYIADRNRYLIEGANHCWTPMDPSGFRQYARLVETQEVKWFNENLHQLNRVKSTVVNTFNKTSPDVLNFLSTQDWLKPQEGPVDEIFNILFDSLSGGRQTVRDHIEKVFVYKYLHPEEYTLPCITISGEGGVGKNEVIEKVFATIFGDQQIAALGTEEAFGNFNGQMLGKTIVYIDEAIPSKVGAELLKRKAGNKTLQINVKYGVQGTYDNTPWYWLGGNGTNGNLFLSGDSVDRRYSVITVTRNLMHWVGKHLGMEVDGMGSSLPDGHPCVVWWSENKHHLSNPESVARWLHSVIEKWGSQSYAPSALHDEDYHALIEAQKSEFQETMEWVFDDENFTHIERPTLYQVYVCKCKESQSQPRQQKNFHADVKAWLHKNKKPYECTKLNVKIGDKKHRTADVYKSGRGTVTPNDHYYITFDELRRRDMVAERESRNKEMFEFEVS